MQIVIFYVMGAINMIQHILPISTKLIANSKKEVYRKLVIKFM